MKLKVVIFISILLIVQITGAISINEIEHVSDVETSKELLSDIHKSRNHQWPMYKHDAQHTGLSDYDTSQNPGFERWKYFFEWSSTATAVIDKSGNLFVPTMVELHSVYPNGTQKWKHDLIGFNGYEPLIDTNGTIYIGTEKRFHAFSPNGSLKWILDIDKNFCGYPAISPEDIIYVGTNEGNLYALYPNGTIRWEFKVNDIIRAPAIDYEGNIYFTTYNNNYLYCLYPNGTLKWNFQAVAGFRNGPVIGIDGTIYLAPATIWVQAVNPNGTEKWRTKLENGGAAIPSLAPDGTLIISGQSEYVNALDPDDGSVIWTYNVGVETGDQTSAVIGADGTIYFAYNEYHSSYKGYLCALNSDGTLKWKTRLTSDIKPYDGMNILSDPSIGSDGTVYITTWFFGSNGPYPSWGYIHAIGQLDPNAPEAPTINGKNKGKAGEEYEYTFKTISPIGNDVYYFIDWGDNSVESWIGPYPSDAEIIVNHSWNKWGKYNIQARAKDTDNLWSTWSELEVAMPMNQQTNSWWFFQFLQNHPRMFPIIRLLFDLN